MWSLYLYTLNSLCLCSFRSTATARGKYRYPSLSKSLSDATSLSSKAYVSNYFASQRKDIWRGFSLLSKTAKKWNIAPSGCFAAILYTQAMSTRSRQSGGAAQSHPPGTTSSVACRALNSDKAPVLYLIYFVLSVSKVCPKVSDKPERGYFGGLGTLYVFSM